MKYSSMTATISTRVRWCTTIRISVTEVTVEEESPASDLSTLLSGNCTMAYSDGTVPPYSDLATYPHSDLAANPHSNLVLILLQSGLRGGRGCVVLLVILPSATMHHLLFILFLLINHIFFEIVGVDMVEVDPHLLLLLELAEAVGLLDVGLAALEELGVRR
jgi:hypothetical protein